MRRATVVWSNVWPLFLAAVCFLLAAGFQSPHVAELAVNVPGGASFVLHGTIPVPPGTHPRADGQVALTLLDHDGTPVATQVEGVTRYPRAQDGWDVVEVLGTVHVPPGAVAGTRVAYRVQNAPQALVRNPAGPKARGLVNTPGSLMVTAADTFGHQYLAELYRPPAPEDLLKDGAGGRTVRTYSVMLPTTNDIGPPGGALPHLFGVHAYLTRWADEDVISLDLRMNNGPDNHDKASPADDILGDVYFESLELRLPLGWVVLQEGADPLFGARRVENEWAFVSIVAERADGRMHFMPSQGQFHRRLVLCPAGQEALAQRYLEHRTLGFCQDGKSTSGDRLWSWWNPGTARYFPQKYPLPSLAHVTPAVKANDIEKALGPLLVALQTGQKATSGMIATDKLGYAHPWGAPYGGVTGGSEIWMFDGIVTAEMASQRGYLLASLTHRTYQDRQPDVLFNIDGRPTEVEDWLQNSPNGLHTGMNFYETLKPGPDPFGFDEAPMFHVEHVRSAGQDPPYEAALRGYKYIDQQHSIRTTRSAKVLVWLGNDHLAKDDLRMRAEIFRLGFHQYNNTASGNFAGGGLKGILAEAATHPGAGLGIGRASGWGVDSVNAAYSFGDDAYRGELQAWYTLLAEALTAGQMCNGFLQAKASDKGLGGAYNVRQQYEQAILENSWRGALETALRGVNEPAAAKMSAVIGKATKAMISPMSWSPEMRAPFSQLAVTSLAEPVTVFCDLPHPPGGTSKGADKTQCWSSFAYGYAVTGDPMLLSKAAEMAGGDLRQKLHAAGLSNLGNRAALLALTQN